LPSSIIETLKAFDAAVEENVSIVLATINEHLAMDKRLVLEADIVTSRMLARSTQPIGHVLSACGRRLTTSLQQQENT